MSARLIPNEIVRATNGRLACGNALAMLNGVCTSVSKVSPGCLFVPLKIDAADGHRDIDAALSKGAGGALCERSSGKGAGLVKKWPLKIIVDVDDSLEGLLNLACFWRHKINAPAVIGTAGSEPILNLAATMLKAKKNPLYLQTHKNMLHETALNLLGLNANHGWVLIEMKHDCTETAERLCKMCMPSIAVVTDETPCARALMESLEPPAVVFVAEDSLIAVDCKPRKGIQIIPCGPDNTPDKAVALPADDDARTRMCMALALVRHLGLSPQDMRAGLDAL